MEAYTYYVIILGEKGIKANRMIMIMPSTEGGWVGIEWVGGGKHQNDYYINISVKLIFLLLRTECPLRPKCVDLCRFFSIFKTKYKKCLEIYCPGILDTFKIALGFN